jgi:hypothetical protein
MFRYFGLLLVVSSWLGGYFLISKWYDKNLPTISKHAASDRTASQFFAVLSILLGLAFYYWLIEWLVPHLELTFIFTAILTITILCQLIAALAPDTSGWRKTIHRWAAYTMAILYLPLSILIIISPQLTPLTQVICSLLLIYMFVGFVLVAVMGKARPKYLLLQASYIIAFQLIIIIAAYI